MSADNKILNAIQGPRIVKPTDNEDRVYLISSDTSVNRKSFVPLKIFFADTTFIKCKLPIQQCTESEIEQETNQIMRIGNVISAFPVEMIEMAGSLDE